MTAVVVTCVMTNDDEEIMLGPFNQGVVQDTDKDLNLTAPPTVRDVATGKAILRRIGQHWYVEGRSDAVVRWFVQGYKQQPVEWPYRPGK